MTFDYDRFWAEAMWFHLEADGYANLGLDAVEAAAWANKGFTPTEVRPWRAAGYSPEQAAFHANDFRSVDKALAVDPPTVAP